MKWQEAYPQAEIIPRIYEEAAPGHVPDSIADMLAVMGRAGLVPQGSAGHRRNVLPCAELVTHYTGISRDDARALRRANRKLMSLARRQPGAEICCRKHSRTTSLPVSRQGMNGCAAAGSPSGPHCSPRTRPPIPKAPTASNCHNASTNFSGARVARISPSARHPEKIVEICCDPHRTPETALTTRSAGHIGFLDLGV